MHSSLDRTVLTAIVLLTGLTAWAVAGATGILATASQVVIFLLANLILTFDMLDLIGRIWVTRLHGAAAVGPSVDLCLPDISQAEMLMSLRPYAIIVSVHNAADEIDQFLEALQPLKEFVWVIDDASQDDTLLRLRKQGWHCVDGLVNRRKPGALQHLVKLLPQQVETVVVLDPDVKWCADPSTFRTTLELVISDMQRSGAAAVSPHFKVQRHGWLAECQAFEFELSCGLGRKSLGFFSTNSGVSVYRRAALQEVLGRHSLSVYAEDLENSLLLLSAGHRIYYDDRLSFVTEPKRTWKSWFSQRAGWSLGWAKVYLERLPLFLTISRRSPLGAYQYLFYLGISGILMLPLKLASLAILCLSFAKTMDDLLMLDLLPDNSWDDPALFGLWYAKTIVVLSVACRVALPRGERLRHLATVPFYGLYTMLQFIPITVGFGNLLALRFFGRRFYTDHYDTNPQLYAARTSLSATTRS